MKEGKWVVVDLYYIEDDSNIAVMVKEYLEKRNFKVTICVTIAQAKQLLKEHVPTLVLLDWNMPDGHGDSELEILHSRILALLRRTGNVAEQYLSCDGILIDQNRHAVFCHSEEILLSTAEYQLLLYLMKNKGKTVAREKILEQIWDVNGSYVNNNTLTVTMKRLRDKLYQPKCLKTVRSVGYRMEDTI